MTSFLFHVPSWLITLALVPLAVIVYRFGHRYRKNLVKKGRGGIDSPGTIEGSMLGLSALLLAFTFNMSATKFSERQKLIVEEANKIGTALLRCDLYPDSIRTPLRKDFKEYLEARINYYRAGDNEHKIDEALKQSDLYGLRIWKQVAQQYQKTQTVMPAVQTVPAINSMIDVVATRDAGRRAKVPPIIFFILCVLLGISAFFLGYQKKEEVGAIYLYAWAFMMALTLYVMIELDRPRRGTINLDRSEQKIEELRNLLHE